MGEGICRGVYVAVIEIYIMFHTVSMNNSTNGLVTACT